jgi:hypothetical protein
MVNGRTAQEEFEDTDDSWEEEESPEGSFQFTKADWRKLIRWMNNNVEFVGSPEELVHLAADTFGHPEWMEIDAGSNSRVLYEAQDAFARKGRSVERTAQETSDGIEVFFTLTYLFDDYVNPSSIDSILSKDLKELEKTFNHPMHSEMDDTFEGGVNYWVDFKGHVGLDTLKEIMERYGEGVTENGGNYGGFVAIKGDEHIEFSDWENEFFSDGFGSDEEDSEEDFEDREAKKVAQEEFDSNHGKFENELAKKLYEVSLESGQDEEVGDSSISTWAALFKPELAILYEDSQGFITADEFEDEESLMKHWEMLEKELRFEDAEDSEEDSENF